MPRLVPLIAVLLLALPRVAAAQERTCDLIESGDIERRTEGGIPMIDFLDPFYFRCSDGAELRAQAGTLNEFMREITLTGNVFFQDADRTLTADRAVYNSAIGRLYATGNVVFTNRAEGSTLRGPELEYFRPMPERPVAQVNAGQRPHLTLRPEEADSAAEPLEIDADRVAIVGQSDLTAYGSVVIDRSDLHATAAEARYQAEGENLELRGDAHVESEEYDLSAEVIQARLADGAIEHLRAVTDASLAGEKLTVNAPELQMFFENEHLQRTVARGGPADDSVRAVAVAQGFRLEADSLDALLPGQRLEKVVAIGNARGETVDTTASTPPDSASSPAADTTAVVAQADSAAPSPAALALVSSDWIVGDTVIGFFAVDSTSGADTAQAAPADTAVELRRIVAIGSAQSLYRVAPQEGEPADDGTRRGVNYLAGERIELTFTEGELEVAQVAGLRRGLYLDPIRESGASPPGTPVARPTIPAPGREPS